MITGGMLDIPDNSMAAKLAHISASNSFNFKPKESISRRIGVAFNRQWKLFFNTC
ncbi:MAG: hypothetical protein ACJA0I_001511 [Gammaproteobacteria bacterium]